MGSRDTDSDMARVVILMLSIPRMSSPYDCLCGTEAIHKLISQHQLGCVSIFVTRVD
jgi:hypothetical protein